MPYGIYVPEDAARRASSAGKKWRPSNGTEGEIFMDSWCSECARDKNQNCPILAATLCHEVTDAEYPSDWQYGDDGQPKCTAFETRENEMCELPGSETDKATRDEMRGAEVMAKTLQGINAYFAPRVANADANSHKYAKAAQEARENGDDDEPWSTQP